MHAFDAVKTLITISPEALDVFTLKTMREACQKWLGEHIAMLESLPASEVRRVVREFSPSEASVVHALVDVSDELARRFPKPIRHRIGRS